MNLNTTPNESSIDLANLSQSLKKLQDIRRSSKPFIVEMTLPPNESSALPEPPQEPMPEPKPEQMAEPQTPPPVPAISPKDLKELRMATKQLQVAIEELNRLQDKIPEEVTAKLQSRAVEEAQNFDQILAAILHQRVSEATDQIEPLRLTVTRCREDLEESKGRRIFHTVLTVANILALVWAVVAVVILVFH